MRAGPRTDRPSLRGAVVCCVLAVVALSLGPTGEASVRALLRDAARPGYLMQHWLDAQLASLDLDRWPWTTAGPPLPAVPVVDEVTLAAKNEELRRLRVALASSRRDLERFQRSLGPVRPVDGPVAVERLAAQVLSRADESLAAGGVLLDGGRSSEIEPGRVVVQSIELAAGSEDVSTGDVVLAGAAVVGRTDEVGAWTSTILPVTDPAYRAHVWIVRETTAGPAFDEEGILEGDGRGRCVVKYVPSTASVAVGDHVYSRDPTGRIPQPLYYGQIEKAELRDGAPHWDIVVRPAVSATEIQTVHVLTAWNEERVSSSENRRSSSEQ